jgi:cytochrome c2
MSCDAGGNNSFGSTLHWGPAWPADPYELTHADYVHYESLSDAMHTYGLVWTEDRLFTYVDDESNIVLDVDMKSESFW